MAQKLVSRTHFKRNRTEDQGWQWFWSKEAPNGNTVSVGGEGYDRASAAVNGFFSAEGVSDWEPMPFNWTKGEFNPFPQGYTLQKFADNHFTITQFVEGE